MPPYQRREEGTKATAEEEDGGKGLRKESDFRGFRGHAEGFQGQMGARDYTVHSSFNSTIRVLKYIEDGSYT
jgi:hypothetical protein